MAGVTIAVSIVQSVRDNPLTRFGRVFASLLLFLCATAAAADCLAPAWETRVTPLSAGTYLVNTLAVADMNEDGLLDVVAIKTLPVDQVILAPGVLPKGYFGAGLSVHSGPTLRGVVARDLNGDHHLDLLVFENETVAFFPGNGDGTFGAMTRSSLFNDSELPVTDLTGDQIDDIAGFTYDISGRYLTLFTGSGTGAFVETRRTALRTFPMGLASADLDGDDAADIVVINDDSTLDLFFGNDDGTFDPPVMKETGGFNSKVTLDDIDGDGDVDILVSRSPDTLTIHRNLGGRLFSAKDDYPIVSSFSSSNGAFDFAAADFTGDGIRDIIATALNGFYIATLRGRGDGTFDAPAFDSLQGGQSVGPVGAIVDLDGDGRLDVITTNSGQPVAHAGAVALMNRCGDLTVSLSGEPLVSVATSVTYHVSAFGIPYNLWTPRVPATGTVTLLEGETVLGSAPLDANGNAEVTAPALALGQHALVARYSGDAQYEPAQSSPLTQNVTAETTTTVVSTTPSESIYGEDVVVTAVVTASDGTTPPGFADLTFGTTTWEHVMLPAAKSTGSVTAGSYPVTARYLGNENYPPSASAPITHVVRKAAATAEIGSIMNRDRFGSSVTVYVDVRNARSLPMTGTLRLYDGSALVASLPRDSGTVLFQLDGLAVGRHTFHAAYSGDSNFEPATSPVISHQTFPPSGLHLDVRGNTDGNHLAWTQPDPGTNQWYWGVYGSGAAPSMNFGGLPFTGNQQAIDYWASEGVVQLYRLEVRDSNTQQLVATSPIDLGVRMSFTNDPLLPDMTIRASHLQEILAATNFLRGKAGQSAVAFNDIAVGALIRATHITTLRTRINEARVALNAAPVTWSRTIAAGDVIRVQDFQELREAVH